MKKKYLALFLAALCLLGGCVAEPERDLTSDPAGPVVLLELPQTRQATNYTCGVAVVQSILGYNGHFFRQDVLEKKMASSPEHGTSPEAMMVCLAEYGIGAELVRNLTLGELHALIDNGRPVICFLQAWNDDPAVDYSNEWEDGHYAIAIGYDQGRIYFMDPSTLANYTYIPNGQFLSRWHDGNEEHQIYNGGIVVTNPNPVYRREMFKPML